VAAHAEITGIVEEDDRGGAARVVRREQICADKDVGTARFAEDGAAEMVVVGAETVKSVGEGAGAQVEARIVEEDGAGWFSGGMRVYDAESTRDLGLG
jgi:hypothetical protein